MYAGVLLVLTTALITSMITRTPLILDVIRDRNALYRDVGRAGIENSYMIRVINKQNVPHDYTLSVSGIEGMTLDADTAISIAGESVVSLPVSVVVPHEYAVGGQVIEFRLDSADGSGITVTEENRFRGPTEGY